MASVPWIALSLNRWNCLSLNSASCDSNINHTEPSFRGFLKSLVWLLVGVVKSNHPLFCIRFWEGLCRVQRICYFCSLKLQFTSHAALTLHCTGWGFGLTVWGIFRTDQRWGTCSIQENTSKVDWNGIGLRRMSDFWWCPGGKEEDNEVPDLSTFQWSPKDAKREIVLFVHQNPSSSVFVGFRFNGSTYVSVLMFFATSGSIVVLNECKDQHKIVRTTCRACGAWNRRNNTARRALHVTLCTSFPVGVW